MGRILPLSLLGGCLWIGEGAHEGRVDAEAIGATFANVTPASWSPCVSETPSFTVNVTVSPTHADKRFDTWIEVDGGERLNLSPTTATPATGGRATVSVVIGPESGLGEHACGGVCRVPVLLGLSRLGGTSEVPIELVVVDAGPPQLSGAFAGDPAGVTTDLDLVPTQDSPPASVSVSEWPTVGFTLLDPHAEVGLGGEVLLAACPPEVDPALIPVSDGPCTLVPTSAAPATAGSGLRALLAAAAPLGPLGCQAALAGGRLSLHAVVLNHACGGSFTFPLDEDPPLFVDPDCDGDTVAPPADCDDLDAARAPGLPETWYDGVDTDCDGRSDNDQDGDGADSSTHGGVDCDDTDVTRHPGALEVCDGKDNNCDDLLAVDQVTLTSSAGPVNLTSLQAALDTAVDGDTVTVCAGTYEGPFTVASNLTLASGSPDPAVATLTTAVPGEPVLRIGAPGDGLVVSVSGLTLSGASAVPEGGGIDARGADDLLLTNLVIEGNDAVRGGGLSIGGVATLSGVEVRDNTATNGGGIAVSSGATVTFDAGSVTGNTATATGGGLIVDPDATVDLSGATISRNTAGTEGGGMYAAHSVVVLGSGSFDDNSAEQGGALALRATTVGPIWTVSDVTLTGHLDADSGGAIDAEGDSGTLVLTNIVVEGNEARLDGGGIAARSLGAAPVTVALDNVTLSGNSADVGGAMAVAFAVVTAEGTTASSNTATKGGAFYAIDATLALGVSGAGVTFGANEATGWGGAVYLADDVSALSVVDGLFDGNTASDGGALYTEGSDVDFSGGSLTGNVAADSGGALFIRGGAAVYLRDAIVVDGNVAAGMSQAAYVDDLELVACVGTQVNDPIENTGGVISFSDPDCFEVTANASAGDQCDGC